MSKLIQIIYPCSQEKQNFLQNSLKDLHNAGFSTQIQNPLKHKNTLDEQSNWALEKRSEQLTHCLQNPDTDYLMCARGGYGASSLLDLLPWQTLAKQKPKWLTGFSDVTALHSALWSKLAWPSIHAPMPDSPYWGQKTYKDIDQLLSLLKKPHIMQGNLKIKSLQEPQAEKKSGWLFGGCLSVLCSLLGTSYFPKNLKDCFLFLEDINEPPGRIMRNWEHLLQSKVFSQVSGVILGSFTACHENTNELKKHMARRTQLNIWSSEELGHTSPNFPIVIGASVQIKQRLEWTWSPNTIAPR